MWAHKGLQALRTKHAGRRGQWGTRFREVKEEPTQWAGDTDGTVCPAALGLHKCRHENAAQPIEQQTAMTPTTHPNRSTP